MLEVITHTRTGPAGQAADYGVLFATTLDDVCIDFMRLYCAEAAS